VNDDHGGDATPPGDRARVQVRVDVAPAEAFRIFVEEIDARWRRGRAYRVAATGEGTLHVEPGVGGRLLETYATADGTRTREFGRITVWEPPRRLRFDWSAVNLAPDERAQVDIVFAPQGCATLVTLTHSGWSAIRSDHPVRHGKPLAPFVRDIGMWWDALLGRLRVHALRGG
jgi:hypothetical protein